MDTHASGGSATATTDHDEIRRWVEARGGRPASVAGSHDDTDGGILRIDFGPKEDKLDAIDWDPFFKTFEERKLAFLHGQGTESRFFKFVRR